jgi:uncharacterized surface protein with fasciclin (FAS1) repeats
MSNQSQQEDHMRRNGKILTTALATAIAFAAAPAADAQEPLPAGQPQIQETESDDILGVAQQRGFGEWQRGVQIAGLDQQLGARPHTVFVADDAAYQDVPATQSEAWQTDPEAHRSAIGHTIVEGRLTRDELRQREYVTTIDGQQIPLRVEGERIWVGDAEVREADIAAGTGVIHQVDRVTWPDPTRQAMQQDPVQPALQDPVQPVQPDQVQIDEPVREPVRKY